MTAEMIDTHLHLWEHPELYSWIPRGSVLDDDFSPERVIPHLELAGVTSAVLVQVGDTVDDTLHMLTLAREQSFIAGVVGWIPLDDPAVCRDLLEQYAPSAYLKGIRCLNHDYADARWLLRDGVREGIGILAPADLSLDVVCTTPEHLSTVVGLAVEHPDLRIVIDHLGKPDIAHDGWEPWAGLIAEAASHERVHVKLSGLNTVSRPGAWSGADWQRYVDHALDAFGPGRMMLGSDWPVATLDGDYGTVWSEQLATLAALSPDERTQVMSTTAREFYALGGGDS